MPGDVDFRRVLAEADLLVPRDQVEAALDRMAAGITERLGERDPVLLCVMIGGLVPTGRLLERMDFPLTLDYVHASRYRGGTRGRELHWLRRPDTGLSGRTVLIVDDIFDQGITLDRIAADCERAGAAEVLSAVLVRKDVQRPDALHEPSFVGVEIGDRYVFGYGMDYRNGLRNAPGIYAVKGL